MGHAIGEGDNEMTSDQLNRLIEVVHDRDRPPYTSKELAEAVRARGVRCTPQYIGQL
jgi:hypothetical protein